jgi:hypothetical protein
VYTCDTLLFSEYKSLSELLKKVPVFPFEKKYLDSLALKRLGLYVTLLGPFHNHLIYPPINKGVMDSSSFLGTPV